ncbi:hypothetical protein BKK52_00725 [Rodentibacter trehalosifermentans]|uniref:Bro-N domain-containing protein n=1 Tax=Rodentibacter trehalosifermentans TaxID=1908263 RepID=A0A1V3J743_9PAST|nr:Bro-N domain-containing protein [Rodentibacter trehalosifermentans]OOF50704.1 hypothetical protein BKK52_00725 [Rodentibacter trehalosifermentans]
MTTLTFQTTTLSVINHNSQTYFTAREIGAALGYRNPLGDVSKLYDRHQDEFTPNMTALIDMRTNGGVQKVRIFSLRGCHLIGMLSHTKVAKDFRKWVLDILDKETAQPKQLALPEPDYRIDNISQSEEALALFIRMYSFCFQAHEMQEKLRGTNIPKQMENEIGGQYLYNFKYPLEQTMAKAKQFIQSNTERLALVKAFHQLLD